MASIIGKILSGRYRIYESLGRGGMAEVYKAWDMERATFLALKVLRQDISRDKIFLRRFQREASTLEKLQHPNIVRFYGIEKDDLAIFILMDFIEGTTLQDEIFRAGDKPINPDFIRLVLTSVCSALHYAHRQGVVHCDIKPGNIMINTHGEVLLNDFGISRMADAATSTMVGFGTPAYMAPELVQGKDPTPQSDIYSLGVVLYEMFTGGERPFTGDRANITGSTSEKVRWEQVHLDLTSPRQFNPKLSTALETIIINCLNKDPHKRYPNVLKLREVLEEQISHGEEVLLENDTEINGNQPRSNTENGSESDLEDLKELKAPSKIHFSATSKGKNNPEERRGSAELLAEPSPIRQESRQNLNKATASGGKSFNKKLLRIILFFGIPLIIIIIVIILSINNDPKNAYTTTTAQSQRTATAVVQATTTDQSQKTGPAVVQGTATAQSQRTSTAVVQATGTANAQATIAARALATDMAVIEATQTARAEAAAVATIQAAELIVGQWSFTLNIDHIVPGDGITQAECIELFDNISTLHSYLTIMRDGIGNITGFTSDTNEFSDFQESTLEGQFKDGKLYLTSTGENGGEGSGVILQYILSFKGNHFDGDKVSLNNGSGACCTSVGEVFGERLDD